MRYPANKQTTVHVASLAMVVNKLFVTLVSRLRTQKYKRRHLFCSGSAQRNQRAGSFLWSLYHFLFTSMLVRLHSWVSANQPSPLAHWSKSMSWMLTSTRITPLTQKHTHIHKHTHRRGFTETDVRQCNETRVAPNVTRLIRMITFFFLFAEICMFDSLSVVWFCSTLLIEVHFLFKMFIKHVSRELERR